MCQALGDATGQAHGVCQRLEQQRAVPASANAQVQQVPHAQDERLGLLLDWCCGCCVLLREGCLVVAGATQPHCNEGCQRLQQQ
jgi:predicted RNA methylase